MIESPLFEFRQVGKRFGATRALHDVSLSVCGGEILALIGENGAGKSTLMKLLSGVHPLDDGEMMLSGSLFAPSSPTDSLRSGIAMIYQELNLAKHLTVEENIMLGQEQHWLGWIHRLSHRKIVRDVLEQLGHPELESTRVVGSLSVGSQQIVEIARALVARPRVMIFDEPTSSLPSKDVDRLFMMIERLREQGMAIIYISHFLEEIRRVAKRFVVLRDGQVVARGSLDETRDEEIVSMMAGRSVNTLFPKVEHSLGETQLSVQNLSGRRSPCDVSFGIRAGEIFGLFGLVGAGRTETLRHLFGLDQPEHGAITWKGTRLRSTPRHAIARGIGYLSEDRKTEGLAQNLSITDNLTMSFLKDYSRFGFLNLRVRRMGVQQWMKRLSVKANHSEQSISQLSGGNQQKVAIARVLHQRAELLLFDEPTRGIDVRTKADIYQLIGELAAQGKSIIFVSSYLPELMAICDTIGVMAKGRLRAVRPISEWTEEGILSEALSHDGVTLSPQSNPTTSLL